LSSSDSWPFDAVQKMPLIHNALEAIFQNASEGIVFKIVWND
jgi:hypothetical protein